MIFISYFSNMLKLKMYNKYKSAIAIYVCTINTEIIPIDFYIKKIYIYK